jgi:hypothetical protein
MAFHETSQNAQKSQAIKRDRRHDVRDEREENEAKYREKVDELNRSRDFEIERALTLRAGR